MKQYLPQKSLSKKTGLLCALMLCILGANAQKKAVSTAKKHRTAVVKTNAGTYQIDVATGGTFATPDKAPAIAIEADSKLYSTVFIPLNISGKTSLAEVPVSLTINNSYTDVAPVFENGTTKTVVKIAQNKFTGKNATIYVRVVLLLKKYPDVNGGFAYIQVDKRKSYHKLSFCDCTPGPGDVKEPGDKIPKTGTSTLVSKKAITLLDSTTTFTLDTLKPNFVARVTINLYIQLPKGIGKDTALNVIVKPVQPSPDIVLSDINQKIQLSSDDWNETKDATVIKTFAVGVQQTSLLKKPLALEVYIKGISGTHTVKIMPFKPKAKDTGDKLIENGNAQITPDRAYEITRDYNFTINPTDSLIVNVKLTKGGYKEGHSQLVFSFLDTSLNKHFQILENPIDIKEDEWKDAVDDKKGLIKIPLHLKNLIKNDSIANNVQKMDLIIKGQTQALRGSQRIKLNMPDQPFWAEIGTNFDLLDNLKTNNFYAGVYMFDKDIANINFQWLLKKAKRSKESRPNNISFSGGVYESQSVSIRSINNVFDYKDGASEILDTATGSIKSYKTYRDTGNISATTSIKRVGLFISPMFRITNGKTDANGAHLFIAPYIEMLWQRISAKVDYTKANKTYTITTDTGKLAKIRFDALPYKTQSFDFDFRSHYLGLGVPLYIKENGFNLFFNPVFGATTQGFTIFANQANPNKYTEINQLTTGYNDILNIKRNKSTWHGFYMFQFRLNEVAYGITFSGEIRGITIHESQPVITLALSKKFNLTGLFKPLLSTYK